MEVVELELLEEEEEEEELLFFPGEALMEEDVLRMWTLELLKTDHDHFSLETFLKETISFWNLH